MKTHTANPQIYSECWKIRHFSHSRSQNIATTLIPLYCKFIVISRLNYCEDMKLIVPTLHKFDIRLKLNVKETHRPTSNWTNSKIPRKSKIVRAPSLVETFPNIKQQFEIDLDAMLTVLISKTSCSLFFSFLKNVFNAMLLRVFDNSKHVVNCSKLLVLNRIMCFNQNMCSFKDALVLIRKILYSFDLVQMIYVNHIEHNSH